VITPIELEEIVLALIRLRSQWPPPWDIDDLSRQFVALIRSSSFTVRQLNELGILSCSDGTLWNLTREGSDVLEAVNNGQWYPLVMLVLRSGELERDILHFLGSAELRSGEARLATSRARSLCPMLAGILSWNWKWRINADFVMPVDVLQRALVEIPLTLGPYGESQIAGSRDGYMSRAAAYSLRLERKKRGVERVLYVADEERDELGYDLEDISVNPSRLIRCIGSGIKQDEWLLTSPSTDSEIRCDIHYWGEISLGRPPRDEYLILRRMGYPRVKGKNWAV
jgi:hypothetical protein